MPGRAQLKNTEIVTLQSQRSSVCPVETLEKKVDKLSIIIENKDVELSENRHIIRHSSASTWMSPRLSVLLLKAEYDRKKKLNLKGGQRS